MIANEDEGGRGVVRWKAMFEDVCGKKRVTSVKSVERMGGEAEYWGGECVLYEVENKEL